MAATRLRIFVSSVQKEFETLRHDLKAFLLGDAFLRRFVAEVFLFEELPARDQRADQLYLAEVERCDIYLGVLGYDYGGEDAQGISPTEHEYLHATKHRKTRLIYVWGVDEARRAPKMKSLIRRASAELVRRRVEDTNALNSEVYASLVDYLDDLRHDHPSVPNNPLIAESLYLTRYIEKAGSGTQRMIELCREAGLPEPDYELKQGSFVLTIWKDWLTDEMMKNLGLSERQKQGLACVRAENKITSGRYQEVTGVTRQTATRDLDAMVKMHLLERFGERRWSSYTLAKSMPHL